MPDPRPGRLNRVARIGGLSLIGVLAGLGLWFLGQAVASQTPLGNRQ